MRIFLKTKKNVKILLLLAGLVTAGLKGIEYLPASIPTSITTGTEHLPSSTPVAPLDVPASVEHLKVFLHDDNLNRPHQLLYRKSYIASYNSQTKCPNWVLWKLTREKADGTVKRPDYAFHEDMEVPAPRAELSDYKGSGYDRGHMCPAGDNKWDADAMYESFLMTNICPQNQQLNSGRWNQIEMKCRYWAKKYGDIYIICGPIFLDGEHKTIGDNHVMVPEAFFKVVVKLDNSPKGIAFICENSDDNRKNGLEVNNIHQVETITGYTFFPNLDKEVAERIKGQADLASWK